VKGKLVRYLNEHEGKNLTETSLRIWKCNYQYNNRDKMVEFLKEHKIGGPNTPYSGLPNKDPDIEENTGVAFPGQQLDVYLEKTYREGEKNGLSISSYFDLIVVE
jgi:hypothetical protein